MEPAAVSKDGRVFRERAAATGNARSPSSDQRVDGMTRVDIAADRRWEKSAHIRQIYRVRQTDRRTDKLQCEIRSVSWKLESRIMNETFNDGYWSHIGQKVKLMSLQLKV